MSREFVGEIKRWLIFVCIVALLAAGVWFGMPLIKHRSLNGTIQSISTSNTVDIGLISQMENIDIRSNSDANVERVLLNNVYETLVKRGSDNSLKPGIAKNWQVSDDGLTYTFTLHNNMTFSNGDKLDASSVVGSFEQLFNEKWLGSDQLSALSGITNPDNQTVKFTLSRPDPQLLDTLAGRAGIIYDAKRNPDYATSALGSGPFTVASFSASHGLKLEQNKNYWGTKSVSSSIQFTQFSNVSDLTQALEKGSIDAAVDLDVASANALGSNPTVNVTAGKSLDIITLIYNNDPESMFSDERARQAVRYLVDNNALASSQEQADTVLGGPLGPLEAGYEDLTGLYPFDQAKGASLASYFGLSYWGNLRLIVRPQYEQLANMIASQISYIGVNVNVQVLDGQDYTNTISSRSFDLTIERNYRGASAFASPSTSTSHFDGAGIKDLYDQALQAPSQEEYAKRLQTYAHAVSQAAASDWLYTCHTYVASKPKLESLNANLTDRWIDVTSVSSNS